MNLRISLVSALTCLALVGSVALPAAAASAVTAPGAPVPSDLCPPPSKPGDPGAESTSNSVGVIDSVNFLRTGDSRIARVKAHGFVKNSIIDYASWHALCANRPSATGQLRSGGDGSVDAAIPVVADVSNFIHFDHTTPAGAGATLAFFADDSADTGQPSTPTTVGTPLVRAATVSEGTATFTLTGGHEGDTVFALDDDGSSSSARETFSASGSAVVELPVSDGQPNRVEFHVFPKSGQGTTAFVFSHVLNLSPGASYAFGITRVDFTDAPRTLHIALQGLLPTTPVEIVGGASNASATVDAAGRATLDVPLRPGANQLQVQHSGPSGAVSYLLQLDSGQDSNDIPPSRKPVVRVAPGATPATTLVTVTDRPGHVATIRDRSAKILAEQRLDSTGTATFVLSTPAHELDLWAATAPLDQSPDRKVKFTLAQGHGSNRPAAPTVRETGRSARGVVLEVRGESGTIVSVADSDETTLPLARRIGTSGVAQIVVPLPTAPTTYSVRVSRGDFPSMPATVRVAP